MTIGFLSPCTLIMFLTLSPGANAFVEKDLQSTRGVRPSEAEDNSEVADSRVRFRVRNDASPFPSPNSEFGAKAATFTVTRDSGETFSLVSAAVLAVFDPVDENGWQPFLVAQWKRSEAAEKRSDVRAIGAGVGISFPPKIPEETGANVWPTLTSRKDIYQDIDSTVLAVQLDIVRADWYSELREFLPYLGVVFEERATPGIDDGRWSSAYIGMEWSTRLSWVSPRLEATVKYTYFRDWSAPSASRRRSEDFMNASVGYEFTDPKDLSIKIRPSIVLSREVGINPLTSSTSVRETKLTFGIKIDTY